ncbi:NAD-dependent epimerase/dehydratase family protein [Deferribacterales bacterium RsTz2092]|nr:UDP-glucose 4-epimerase [Deferribacterales bacterium]
MQNNILITGGAGFIGSYLADELVKTAGRVVVVDNLSLGREANLSSALKSGKCELVVGDILDKTLLSDVFYKHSFDVVFHLAANSDVASSTANPAIDKDNTFLTTYEVLNAMRIHNVKRIVFASSSAVYGDAGGMPLGEDYAPLLPASHYGAAKLASEAFISSFVENYGFQAWFARFPNVCGGRATHGVLYDFINKLRKNPSELEVLGDGTQRKPYLYVQELVEAMLYIYKHSDAQINLFNIGGVGETSVSEIAEMLVAKLGLSATIRYGSGARGWVGDVPKFAYKLDKLNALGWRAKLSSTEAVSYAIDALIRGA